MEWEIPSLKIEIYVLANTFDIEERFMHIEHLDEDHRDLLTGNETHNKWLKNQYDNIFKPRVFSEGELFLVYNQDKEPLGEGKFKSMWLGSHAMSKVLNKGEYELVEYDVNNILEPWNGL